MLCYVTFSYLLTGSTWEVLSKRKHGDYGRFFEENVRQGKDMDCMAVDVFMGALVSTRGLRGVHSTRSTSHWRELYVRFVTSSYLWRSIETDGLETS